MENPELQHKIISVARKNPQSDSVPYAFEKRIMACLTASKALDSWALWNRYFSRAAVCSVILVVGLGLGARFIPEEASATNTATASLSQEVEQTLFAAVESQNPEQEIP